MEAPVLPVWFWHAIAGAASLLLVIVASVTGAMLRGRIKRPEGVNVFGLHRWSGIGFVVFMAFTYLQGQYVFPWHSLGLPASPHGWIGLTLIIFGAVQLLPSMFIRRRKPLRLSHMVLGYALGGLAFLQILWGLQIGLSGELRPLVLIHSVGGGLALLGTLWVLFELRRMNAGALLRARFAASVAAISNVVGCWLIGGRVYLTDYRETVRGIIIDSAAPWAHLIVMEAKEHVFIFIPILSLLLALVLGRTAKDSELSGDPSVIRSLVLLTVLVLAMILLMFVLGGVISSAGRLGARGM